MTDTKLTKERVEKLTEWVDRGISRYRYFWPAEDQSFATDLHFLLRSHAVALGEHPQSGERLDKQEKAGATSSIEGYPESAKRALSSPGPTTSPSEEDERGMADEPKLCPFRAAIKVWEEVNVSAKPEGYYPAKKDIGFLLAECLQDKCQMWHRKKTLEDACGFVVGHEDEHCGLAGKP